MSPILVGVYGLQSPRIPREHTKYHGYTVRGTPNWDGSCCFFMFLLNMFLTKSRLVTTNINFKKDNWTFLLLSPGKKHHERNASLHFLKQNRGILDPYLRFANVSVVATKNPKKYSYQMVVSLPSGKLT